MATTSYVYYLIPKGDHFKIGVTDNDAAAIGNGTEIKIRTVDVDADEPYDNQQLLELNPKFELQFAMAVAGEVYKLLTGRDDPLLLRESIKLESDYRGWVTSNKIKSTPPMRGYNLRSNRIVYEREGRDDDES